MLVQADRATASHAEGFREAFELAGVGLAQADPASGRLLQVNAALAEMLGHTPRELLGRSFLDFTHPDERAANWAGFQRVMQGELQRFDTDKRLLHRDGQALWVQMALRAVRDQHGRALHSVAAVIDITARKQAEAALADSRERLQLALDASHLGLWEWDLDSGTLSYSPEVLVITGLPAEALGADVAAARRLVHPDDIEAVWASDEAARTGRPFSAEYRIVRPDGRLRWVANHARTLCDADGRPRRMIGTLADITARKQAEWALRESHDELEARVHERTEALEASNSRLANEVAERRATEAQVRELLGQLVGAEEDERRRMARELHDTVGQHLTAITLTLKAVEEDPSLPDALRQRLVQLQRATRQLDHDIDRLSHELRPAALDDLGLDDALRQHAAAWGQDSGITLELHTHGLRGRRLPASVETTVYRVVQEALTNVLKHSGATRVGVIAELRENELRAIVEDDGRGFEAQADTATGQAPRTPGTPINPSRRRLGLRGMAERATLAGGRLEVESQPGLGTTLYLTIPLPEDDLP
jgi:PAS domain S-box-containing protein